jgi:hypothetical protein
MAALQIELQSDRGASHTLEVCGALSVSRTLDLADATCDDARPDSPERQYMLVRRCSFGSHHNNNTAQVRTTAETMPSCDRLPQRSTIDTRPS